jgi:hypothetical protein
MMHYRRKTIRPDDPPGARVVHNFYPGPLDDPGRSRPHGYNGFRYWVTDEPMGHRCYCGWDNGREHYGTVSWVDVNRTARSINRSARSLP